MAKKRKSKKVKIRIFFIFVIFSAIIGYLSYCFLSNVDKILSIKREKNHLEEKLVNLKEEEDTLNSDIKKLKDPDYVARYAREKYMYSKDGEIILRLPDDAE